MAGVSARLSLESPILFLGVRLLDLALARSAATPDGVALVGYLHAAGAAAVWVAAKFEGRHRAPRAAQLLQELATLPGHVEGLHRSASSDSSTSSGNGGSGSNALVTAEARLLSLIGDRLLAPTTATFLQMWLAMYPFVSSAAAAATAYIAELSLLDGVLQACPPSCIAAGALLLGHELAHVPAPPCAELTGYERLELEPYLDRLSRVHHAACSTPTPCAISSKYCSPLLHAVALLRPRPSLQHQHGDGVGPGVIRGSERHACGDVARSGESALLVQV